MPCFRPELILEKVVQCGEVLDGRHDHKFGTETDLEDVHQPMRLRGEIGLEVRSNQGGAQPPQAVRELKVRTLLGSPFTQRGNNEQEVAHDVSTDGTGSTAAADHPVGKLGAAVRPNTLVR